MKLNELTVNPGATKNRKRVGRGPASGTGKTSGAGHKGQKARKGVAINGFEGGQNPLYRRTPKRGFTNIFRTEYSEVTTTRLQHAVDKGTLSSNDTISRSTLLSAGIINCPNAPIKILAGDKLKVSLSVQVEKATAGAIKLIEAAKGSFTSTLTTQSEAKTIKSKKITSDE